MKGNKKDNNDNMLKELDRINKSSINEGEETFENINEINLSTEKHVRIDIEEEEKVYKGMYL